MKRVQLLLISEKFWIWKQTLKKWEKVPQKGLFLKSLMSNWNWNLSEFDVCAFKSNKTNCHYEKGEWENCLDNFSAEKWNTWKFYSFSTNEDFMVFARFSVVFDISLAHIMKYIRASNSKAHVSIENNLMLLISDPLTYTSSNLTSCFNKNKWRF